MMIGWHVQRAEQSYLAFQSPNLEWVPASDFFLACEKPARRRMPAHACRTIPYWAYVQDSTQPLFLRPRLRVHAPRAISRLLVWPPEVKADYLQALIAAGFKWKKLPSTRFNWP